MRSSKPLAVLALAFATALITAPPARARSTPVQKAAKPAALDVGSVAPPIGALEWAQLGDGVKVAPDLAALRGEVVVVATYGYSSESCVRSGVPTLNALRKANLKDQLAIVALTALIGDDTTEKVRAEAQKLAIEAPVGIANIDGSLTPYLDMDANGNLTYAFVIGRTGGLVWRGDPSKKRDDYVGAVTSALAAVPARPLPVEWMTGVAPELAPALREYVFGDFVKAQTTLAALTKKLANAKSPEAERARTQAAQLGALVDGTRKDLMDVLEKTGGAKDAEKFQRTLLHVRHGFPKGECADRASQLELYMTMQSDQGPSCKKWLDWYELEAARPATFPAEKTPAAQKYARELGLYAKQPGVPGLEHVRAWLNDYALLK